MGIPKTSRVWIGFYYDTKTTEFKSRNNVTIFHPWYQNEPDGNGDEGCVIIAEEFLFDVACDKPSNAVSLCQRFRRGVFCLGI